MNRITALPPAKANARSGSTSELRNSSSDDKGSLLYRFGHDYGQPTMSQEDADLLMKMNEEESVLSQISSLTKIRPKTLKIVSGSQFRLTTRSSSQCEQCEYFDKMNKKNKEVIRSLKLQLARLEESFKDLKFSKALEQTFVEAKYVPEIDTKGGENGSSTRKVERLEEEVLRLKRMISFERNTSEALRQSLEELRTASGETENKMKADLEKHLSQIAILSEANAGLKVQLEKALLECSELKSLLEDGNTLSLRHQNSESTMNEEIIRLKQEVEKLEAANKTAATTLQQKAAVLSNLEAKNNSLNGVILGLESKISSLESEIIAVNASIKSSQEQVNTFKKRCEGLEGSVKNITAEKDSFKAMLLERDATLIEKDSKIHRLEQELASQLTKTNDLYKRVAIESETTKKALEKSIASSVRLCVVAPTVNVHVNEGKMKYKSKLPESSLKTFLHNEVFDKYCFLFKQTSENAGPVAGENLESWLQKMLSQMQTSIENHVNSAMEGSSM